MRCVSPYVDVTAVNVLDGDTIEVYIDYWNEDKAVIAAVAGLWPTIPVGDPPCHGRGSTRGYSPLVFY